MHDQDTQTETLNKPIVSVKITLSLSLSLFQSKKPLPNKNNNTKTTSHTTTTQSSKQKNLTSDSDIHTKHTAKKVTLAPLLDDKNFKTKEFSAMNQDIHSTDSGSDFQDTSSGEDSD